MFYIYISTYIYTYTERERKRKREIHKCIWERDSICIHLRNGIYLYTMKTYTYIHYNTSIAHGSIVKSVIYMYTPRKRFYTSLLSILISCIYTLYALYIRNVILFSLSKDAVQPKTAKWESVSSKIKHFILSFLIPMGKLTLQFPVLQLNLYRAH